MRTCAISCIGASYLLMLMLLSMLMPMRMLVPRLMFMWQIMSVLILHCGQDGHQPKTRCTHQPAYIYLRQWPKMGPELFHKGFPARGPKTHGGHCRVVPAGPEPLDPWARGLGEWALHGPLATWAHGLGKWAMGSGPLFTICLYPLVGNHPPTAGHPASSRPS